MSDPRRQLPSMDALLKGPAIDAWVARYGRDTVKVSLRRVLDEARISLPQGSTSRTVRELLTAAEVDLRDRSRRSLVGALNGTGVVLHTNLGRAPLGEEARQAQAEASGYGNVELSLATGDRGSRYDHCAGLVCELTGAEAAVVTNNNAAAVALVVNELARDEEVLVSRGELVEIGGSFRIPDVIARSGATLTEVGTTNRTRVGDYEDALGASTALILRVHPSNYRVEGFAERPEITELVEFARSRNVPFVHDVGSGLLRRDLLPGFPEEPTVDTSLKAGVDLVTWSGDKLLGGPQAGIIAGDGALVARLRKNPLLRAFRVGKTTLAALEATLMLYRDTELAARRVPTLRMLRESVEEVEARARGALFDPPPGSGVSVEVRRTQAVVGGGAYPGFQLESAGWVLRGVDPDRLAETCRAGDPPLLGRIEQDAFIVDVRTIPQGEEALAAGLLRSALGRLATVHDD